MAYTAYIYGKKSWSIGFPDSLYLACTAYIYYENVAKETSPRACTWPVQPVFMLKNVGPETFLGPLHDLFRIHIAEKR
jgi:hypothetical protein